MQLYTFMPANDKKDKTYFNEPRSDGGSKTDSKILESVKILIVDDQPDFLEALQYILMKNNIHCVAVNSGREAIAAVSEHSFDLILLDVVMPDMNGLDTYRRIREAHCLCPVIFMSAYNKYEKEIEGLRPFAFLKKPIDYGLLFSSILELGGGGGRQGNG